jgi:hypothetical protein
LFFAVFSAVFSHYSSIFCSSACRLSFVIQTLLIHGVWWTKFLLFFHFASSTFITNIPNIRERKQFSQRSNCRVYRLIRTQSYHCEQRSHSWFSIKCLNNLN